MTAPLHRFASLDRVEGLSHGFSTREGPGGAPLAVSLRACPDAARCSITRAAVARAAGADPERLVFGEQVHGAGVAIVGEGNLGRAPVPRVDALVTGTQGVWLAGLSADCPMVFLADPVRRAVGLVHSGWRSTVLGASRAAVEAMQASFGSRPGDLVAAVSPSIGPCCFEVREDFVAQAMPAFRGREELLLRREGHTTFDLWEALRLQLLDAGLVDANVEVARLCTRCLGDRFFSHRREGALGGRCMSVMGWRG